MIYEEDFDYMRELIGRFEEGFKELQRKREGKQND